MVSCLFTFLKQATKTLSMLKLLKISHWAQFYSVRQVTERISPLVDNLTCYGCDKPHQCWFMLAQLRLITGTCCAAGLGQCIMRNASPGACLASSSIESPPPPLSLPPVQLFFAIRLRYLRMLLSQSGGKCDFVCVFFIFSHGCWSG